MESENPRTGLWRKKSKFEGSDYYSGKITIDGVEYWANLYQNDRPKGDRPADLNLVLKRADVQRAPDDTQPVDHGDIPF